MNKLLLGLAISLATLIPFKANAYKEIPMGATGIDKTGSDNSQCAVTIYKNIDQITIIDPKVSYTFYQDDYADYNDEYWLSIGVSNTDIMTSPVYRQTIANSIIKDCQGYFDKVMFGMHQTDWIYFHY